MRWNIFSSQSSEAGPSNISASSPPPPPPPTVSEPATSRPSTSSSSHHSAPTLNRFERSLQDEEKYQELQYPTFEDVPGCMRLFDEFMMCYALVPQLRNLYRHGELHDCTYKFHDFKYCMSLKGEDTEDRRKLWVRRRAEWWAARRVGASSEDVWDMRTERLDNFPPLQTDDVPVDST